jgi:hypothetical protein
MWLSPAEHTSPWSANIARIAEPPNQRSSDSGRLTRRTSVMR